MALSAGRDGFRPAASWQNLRLRAEIVRKIRAFFDARGFLEVETPLLSADTVVDRHLDPFAVAVGRPQPFWLQTSPEFAMKRLLAAGAEAIYQVAHVFRQDERGPLHNPEFTMVEWYRAGDTLAAGMQLTSDLAELVLGRGPAEQLSYEAAFLRYAGLDPHRADIATLMAVARQCPTPPPESLATEDRDGWLDWLLVERVQPHLGVARPTLLYDFPASQAALAIVRGAGCQPASPSCGAGCQPAVPVADSKSAPQPPVAERFELYVSGIELANGYHELTDAAELRRRNASVNAQREADGKPALPAESRLLAAMDAGLPPAVGVALGLDRLVMLAAGAATLDAVLAFPFDRA
jgi:elongation factor P--(R)-beta-lysine ligase